jgi:hypothetical protein
MAPQPAAKITFGIRRGHPVAVVHGPHPALRPPPPAVRASPGLPSPPSPPRLRCPGGAVCWLARLASWTVAPVSPRTSARLPEPAAGSGPAVAFGACSLRTSGSPRLVVGPILKGRGPHSLPIESPLVPEAKARPVSSRARKRGVPGKRRRDRVGTVVPAGSLCEPGRSVTKQGKGPGPGPLLAGARGFEPRTSSASQMAVASSEAAGH